MTRNTITFAAKFAESNSPRIAELRRIGWDQHDVDTLSRTINDTRFQADKIEYLYLRRLNVPTFSRGRIARPITNFNNGHAFPVYLDVSGPFSLDSVHTTSPVKETTMRLTKAQYLSLIAMHSVLGMHETVKTQAKAEDSTGREHSLRIFGTFADDVVRDRYCSNVAERFNAYHLQAEADTSDFWWDTANHTFLTFDRNFAQTLPALLVSTMKTVNTL